LQLQGWLAGCLSAAARFGCKNGLFGPYGNNYLLIFPGSKLVANLNGAYSFEGSRLLFSSIPSTAPLCHGQRVLDFLSIWISFPSIRTFRAVGERDRSLHEQQHS
jgi:hypothetical protein